MLLRIFSIVEKISRIDGIEPVSLFHDSILSTLLIFALLNDSILSRFVRFFRSNRWFLHHFSSIRFAVLLQSVLTLSFENLSFSISILASTSVFPL